MVDEKFLDELEQKIQDLRRVLRRKAGMDTKIAIQVPFVNKQIEYIITEVDRQAIEQEIANKEKVLTDKFKEVTKSKI